MALSKIEWTDYTLNHWNGCTAVAEECDNCYAEARDARFNKGEAKHWGPGAERQRHELPTRNAARKWNVTNHFECGCGWRGTRAQFKEPPMGIGRTLTGAAGCPECGANSRMKAVRARVFAQSLSDTFDNEVPQEWRDELFALAEECTNLDFLFLTKRIGNVRKMVPARWLQSGGWPAHIRLGVTAGTQKAADRDIPQLLALPCPNFVSMEPLLERVDISRWLMIQCDNGSVHIDGGGRTHMRCNGNGPSCPGIEWVIDGGESGRGEGIRPSHPDWFRLNRDNCEAAGVPYLHKQNGEWVSVSEVAGIGKHYHFADGATVRRVGKEKAGRTLDGRTYDGFPKAAAA